MSRVQRPHRPKRASAPAPGRARGPGDRPPLAALVVVGLLLVSAIAAASWWRSRLERAATPATAPRTAAMPLDSVRVVAAWFEAANARGDWPEALRLAERLAATLPTNSLAIRQLALAEHNLRNPLASPRHGQRPVLRTSLDRARAESTTVALLDSAARVATTPADRARAYYWLGKVREYQGLPLDAMHAYERALAADPADEASLRAAAGVVAGLRGAASGAR